MINRVVLVGRITKEVELKYTSSNIPVTQFTLAVNRKFNSASGEKQADFIQCVTWRQSAEFMSKYVRKGALLGIEGRIETRNYEDNTGQTRYVTEVLAESVQILESKSENTNNNYEPKSNRNDQSDAFYKASAELVTDDDLPF